MKRVRVIGSSVVRSIGYEAGARTLEVRFTSGEVYQYLDVEPGDVEAFFAAESKGTFLNEHIKPRYEAVHIDPQ